MEYQLYHSIPHQQNTNSWPDITGAISHRYDVFQTDSTVSATLPKFAHVLADYQNTHQFANESPYSNHPSDALSVSPSNINQIYDDSDRLAESSGIDDARSNTHSSALSNQTEHNERLDQNIDQDKHHDLAVDNGDSRQDTSNPPDDQSDTDQELPIHNAVKKETVALPQQLPNQDMAEDDTTIHLAIANAINANENMAKTQHTEIAIEPVSLNRLVAQNKKPHVSSHTAPNIRQSTLLADIPSSEEQLSDKDTTSLSKQSTQKSLIDAAGDELSNSQVDIRTIVSAKKISNNTQVPVSAASDLPPSLNESIRYSLIDNRMIKNIDPNTTFAELNTKDQPIVLRDFRQFLDDIGHDSIVRHARLVIKGDQNGELRLLVKPPELGVMRIKFSLHQNTVEGKFIVDNVLAKDVIERSLADIQRHLRDNGLDSRGIEVSINNNSNYSSARFNRSGGHLPNNKAYVSAVPTEISDDALNSHLYLKKNNTALIDLLA